MKPAEIGREGAARRLLGGLTAVLCQDLCQVSVKVFFALMTCANDKNQFWRAYIEAKDIPGRSEGSNELAQRWSLIYLAVTVGATHSLGADEQLLLEGQVRVMCTQDAVTAIFEGTSTGEDKLDALFESCRLQGGLLPFTTRAGQMALRLSSQGDADETASALQKLRAVMARLETGPPQEPA